MLECDTYLEVNSVWSLSRFHLIHMFSITEKAVPIVSRWEWNLGFCCPDLQQLRESAKLDALGKRRDRVKFVMEKVVSDVLVVKSKGYDK